jgi:hypothetical protein
MPNESAPTCPTCGGSDVRPIGAKDGYANDPPLPDEKPLASAIVYLCRCGATFAQVERRKPAQRDNPAG